MGNGLLDGPDWGFTRHALPAGLVDCCEFLRRTAAPADLVQDFRNDPQRFIQALSERRAYFFHLATQTNLPPALLQREAALKNVWNARTLDELLKFAVEREIKWLLLQPGDAVAWPDEMLKDPVYESQGYRVYHVKITE